MPIKLRPGRKLVSKAGSWRNLRLLISLISLSVIVVGVIAAVLVERAVAPGQSAALPQVSDARAQRHACPSSATRARSNQSVLFGNRTVQPRRARVPGGVAQAFPFHSTRSGTARSVCVYIDRHTGARRVVVGIYASSHGHPGALLSEGSASSPRAGAWNLVHIAAVQVTAGGRYWVAMLGEHGGVAVRQRPSTRCHGVKMNHHGMSRMPSSWLASSRWAGCPVSAYVIGAGLTAAPIATGPAPPGPGSGSPPIPGAPGVPQHCDTTFTPSTWSASAVESAGTGGQTLCLSAGTYSKIEFIGYHPSSMIAIEPVSGQTVHLGAVTFTGASNVAIAGFGPTNGSSDVDGMLAQGEYEGPNYNIVWSYNFMSTQGVWVTQNAMTNANILITHNWFVGFTSSGESDRIDLDTRSASNCPNGVVVSYNLIKGGESDGIDVAGGNCGSQILNNEITGIIESNCNGIHCDAIQDAGDGKQTLISGNYFHNNSDGLLFDNGNVGPDIITNNVFDNPTYRCTEGIYGDGTVFDHNTFDCEVNISSTTTNVNFTNNIMGPSSLAQLTFYPTDACCTFKTLDYNLHASGAYNGRPTGSHDIIGSPIYIGGTEPSTYAGWALASNSPGVGRASDGTNLGAALGSVGP
jgi:hypothetical protein